jgi:uncharacterized membrane protein YsdA (DUF1294 family)
MSTFAVCFNRICEMDFLPKDPAILVSSVRSSSARLLPKGRKNMLLRDEEFDTLESLCYRSNLFACQSKNVVTFFVYGIDKWKAKKFMWRVSEAALLGLAVVGGSIGAWLGMKVWHHKTQHKKFKYGVPVIIIIQLALICYLFEQ